MHRSSLSSRPSIPPTRHILSGCRVAAASLTTDYDQSQPSIIMRISRLPPATPVFLDTNRYTRDEPNTVRRQPTFHIRQATFHIRQECKITKQTQAGRLRVTPALETFNFRRAHRNPRAKP